MEHYDGQDDEHHFEGSLLHGVHLVSARPRLPQGPQDGDVAEDHEGKRSEDHAHVDLGGAGNDFCARSNGIAQNDDPDHAGQDRSVLAVLQPGEGDWMMYSYIAVQADAGQDQR